MTGDHSCIMLKVLNKEEEEERSGEGGWLTSLWSGKFIHLCLDLCMILVFIFESFILNLIIYIRCFNGV